MKPELAAGPDRIANRAVGIVGLLEEALISAQERLGERMRPRRIEREQLALDLVEPGFKRSAEGGCGTPPNEPPRALPSLQPRSELGGEACRIRCERMPSQARLGLGIRGGELGKQRDQLLLRLAAQRFEALIQRSGSRILLPSHVARATAEQNASVEGPQGLKMECMSDDAMTDLAGGDAWHSSRVAVVLLLHSQAHLFANASQHADQRIDGEFFDLVIDHVGDPRPS